ncbi:MAG: DCC1-like thiol-disulfide oxidoreductase family protein [Bacteroidota bacterium]|nr:DCC1-like thiol-disulfide oxidoreductase family protein [Bacteroidota bacterium]
MHTDNKNIILFDDICVLCNAFAKFIIRNDKADQFRFGSLQSAISKNILVGLGQDHTKLDSVVLIIEDKIYFKSKAVSKIFIKLGFIWKLFGLLIAISPVFISDFIYDIIAKNRYQLFGKKDHCEMLSSDLRKKFITD